MVKNFLYLWLTVILCFTPNLQPFVRNLCAETASYKSHAEKDQEVTFNLQNFAFGVTVGCRNCFERQRAAVHVVKSPRSPLTSTEACEGVVMCFKCHVATIFVHSYSVLTLFFFPPPFFFIILGRRFLWERVWDFFFFYFYGERGLGSCFVWVLSYLQFSVQLQFDQRMGTP